MTTTTHRPYYSYSIQQLVDELKRLRTVQVFRFSDLVKSEGTVTQEGIQRDIDNRAWQLQQLRMEFNYRQLPYPQE